MKRSTKKGFTIVELVIVIAVIAILTAVLIPTFTSVTAKAKKSAAAQNARNEFNAYVAEKAQDLKVKDFFIKSGDYWFKVEDMEFDSNVIDEPASNRYDDTDLSKEYAVKSFVFPKSYDDKYYTDEACTTEVAAFAAATKYYYKLSAGDTTPKNFTIPAPQSGNYHTMKDWKEDAGLAVTALASGITKDTTYWYTSTDYVIEAQIDDVIIYVAK